MITAYKGVKTYEIRKWTKEFRANYNGEGSSEGQKRAKAVYEILNKFYDGTPGGKYAVNDTGMKLGDLFRADLMQEGNSEMPEDASDALHLFAFSSALDLGDTAYSYNNKKNGVYFFWHEDGNAYSNNSTAASVFSVGYLVFAAGLGLAAGVVLGTLIFRPWRRKKNNS